MVAMNFDEDSLRDAVDVEREAIRAEAAAQDAADGRAELLERLLAGATEKRDWAAVARHAEALRTLRTGVEARAGWPLILGAELLQPQAPIPWVCEELAIAPGPPTLIAGYGFSGKTAACQHLALSVALGLDAWCRYPVRQGRVLHVDYEQGRYLTVERYQRILRAMVAVGRVSVEQAALFATQLEVAIMPPVYLDAQTAEDSYMRQCEGHTLCVIDSLRAAAPNTDENDSKARVPLDRLARVSERTGCAFVLIHHARKDKEGMDSAGAQSIRGSGALFDACQRVIILTSKGAPKKEPGRNYACVVFDKDRISGKSRESAILAYEDVDELGSRTPDSRHGLLVSASDVDSSETADALIDAMATRVLDYVKSHARCSTSELRIGVRGDTGIKAAALDRLKRTGAIRNSGKGNAAQWVAVIFGGQSEQ